MRLLLLGVTGEEPSYLAWRTSLERAGVPYEAATLAIDGPPLALTARSDQATFQASILATDDVLDALPAASREALVMLEREAGPRRLIAYAEPDPSHGLCPARWEGPLEELDAALTSDGLAVFPYLRGRLPTDPGSWCYAARPLPGEDFRTLLEGGDGSALVGIHRRSDGGEQMIQTFDANSGQAQGHVLRHGQLVWLTRGVYLGYERHYLPLHIDDVLLGNHGWSLDRHAADRDPGAVIRMTPSDAGRAARWSRIRRLRLDLACNGAGSERFLRAAGLDTDPLLAALAANRDAFGWINHTYEHLNLDDAAALAIEAEIKRNVIWARRARIELEPGVLVTGEHTGLANVAVTPPRGENQHLTGALAAQGIRYLACDASRPYPVLGDDPAGLLWPAGAPFAVGMALAVPRHPTSLPFDAATATQALDRIHLAEPGGAPRSWAAVVSAEARRMFVAVVGNDPRPHYFHQSNLAGEGIFYALVDAVLDRYGRYLTGDTPIAQPTLGDAGELISRWLTWRAALADGSVGGYFDGRRVMIVNNSSVALEVPVTGPRLGERYAGTRSGWIRATRGTTVVEP